MKNSHKKLRVVVADFGLLRVELGPGNLLTFEDFDHFSVMLDIL